MPKAETPIDPVAPSIEIFFFIYLKNINKNMKPAGKPNKMPSTLSKMPPWPGSRFPVSFFFAFLLRREKNKSPIWQKSEVIKPVKIIMKLIFFVIKKRIPLNVMQLRIIDPMDPEIVLLGLILVIFGPLNVLPNIYPPISEAIQVNKRENKIILNSIIFEKIKKSKQKININRMKIKL